MKTEWKTLLEEALAKPGKLSEAYSRFWNYSLGNQLLAMEQCASRGVPLGPLNTFQGWKSLGRWVRKGERALTLCMPVAGVKTEKVTDDDGAEKYQPRVVTRFIYRSYWFTLGQTCGNEYQPQEMPGWSEERALGALGIERIPFESADGNCQGYSTGKAVAINPVAALPHKTLFHELAHCVLGHVGSEIPREQRELEAECVALICVEALGLPGAEECRGYVQAWWKAESFPEESAQRVVMAADKVLKAGVK